MTEFVGEKVMSTIARYALFVCGLLVVVGIVVVILIVRAEAGIFEQTAASTMGPKPIDEQYLIPNAGVAMEKIIGGTVIEINGNSIIADSSKYGLVTLHISKETRIWKGEWDSELPIEVGDFFYGYGEPDQDGAIWEMEQMEVNIVNLRGAIVSVEETSEGLAWQLEESCASQLYTVHVTSRTLLVSDEGQDMPFAEAQVDFKPGDGVQIIGLTLKDGTVLATRIF